MIYTYRAGACLFTLAWCFFCHIIIDMSFITPKFLRRLLCFLLSLRLLFLFWSNLPLYTQSFDPQVAKDAYFSSTYIRGDKGKSTLSDSDLYLVEGHFLVGENYDLEKLTPGHPPLGKYLIGFSWKYLGNPYILQFVSFALVLVLISLLAGTPLLGLIFSFEPLLIEQLSLTLLDIHFLVLILSSLLFFTRFIKQKKVKKQNFSLILSWLFLGLAMATKFFPVTFPLIGAYFLLILLQGDFSRFIRLALSFPLVGLGFGLGHLSYFFYHPSILSFARFTRYQINWWAGSPQTPPLAIFKVIFLNQWPTWWGKGVIPVPGWWLGWPVLTALSFLSFHNWKTKPFYFYLIISFLFLSVQAIFPRHLLPILPIIYLLSYDTIRWLWLKLKPTK